MITAVRVPASVDAAVDLAARGGWIMGGGTIVMPQVNTGAVGDVELISLRRAGLGGIQPDGGSVRIGAATTLAEVGEHAELGFLAAAVHAIAAPSIRNLATVGGNLFAPQPYGDFAACLLALDATVGVAGPAGPRQCPVDELFRTGPAAGELVTSVTVRLPPAGAWFFHKAMRRKLNSAAIVAVAAVVRTDGGVVTAARIALGGVAPRPVRAVAAERSLTGRPLDRDAVAAAGQAAQADIDPADDAYASAWYRRRVLPVHLRRALLADPPIG